MNLSEILKLKFPAADFLVDIRLQDDGKGPYIREWNLSEPKPNLDTLEEWEKELKSDLIEQQIITNRLAEYPTPNQLSVALWKSVVEKDDTELEKLQAMREEIQAKYPKTGEELE